LKSNEEDGGSEIHFYAMDVMSIAWVLVLWALYGVCYGCGRKTRCRPSNLIYDKKISTANLKGYISNLDIKEQIPNSTSNLSKDTFTKNPMSRHTGRAVYVNGEPTTSLLLLLQKFTCSGGNNGDVV
jgi:hypothetical protein